LLLQPSGDESSASGFLLVHEIHKGSSQSFTPKPFFSLAAAFLAICCRRFFSLLRTMVLVLIYGKRVSLDLAIFQILFVLNNLSVIHRGIHRGESSA
jgi:hypothetical protein